MFMRFAGRGLNATGTARVIVLRADQGWLHGDRQQALREFDLLERIEREGHG
jgi:hypothetical protein